MAQKPYAAMQALIKDQQAAAQAMREAATDISFAANMMYTMFSPGGSGAPGGGGGSGGAAGGAPGGRGNAPTMSQNQVLRPVHSTDPIQRGKGIQGIRNAVSDQLHNKVGVGSGSTFEAIHDPTSGQHIGYRETRTDGTVQDHDKNAPGIGDAVKQAGVRAGATRVINSFGEGGMLAGARALPIVGAGVMVGEAAYQGIAQVGKQRQANAQYQSIYGGSNFGTGFSNRADQEGFKLGQFFSGGLTGGQSDQAFKGVSNLGVQGPQRSADLNFISSSYKSMGVSVAQSLQLIETAAKSLNTNLSGLKDGMTSVSNAAKASGQNAGAARQQFATTYGSISSSNPGTASAPIASAITTGQVALGRNMQGLDFTSQFTTLGGQTQLAAAAGIGVNQLQADLINNPSAALQASDTVMAQIAAPFLKDPAVQSAINAAVQKAGGTDHVKANFGTFAPQLVAAVLNATGGAFGSSVAAAYASRVSSLANITPNQAIQLLIGQFLGVAGNSADTYKAQQAKKQQDLTKVPAQSGAAVGAVGKGNTGNNSLSGQSTAKGVNPVVDDAKTNLKGKNVIVTTKNGEQRVVSIDEAAKDYTDQIAKGTAIVAETGQLVSDALGESESNYVGTDTTTSSPTKGAGSSSGDRSSSRGQSVDAFNAAQAKKDAKTNGGTITVSPSKELLQLLSFSSTGNLIIANTAAANNTTAKPGS